jgi:hypothetical protein
MGTTDRGRRVARVARTGTAVLLARRATTLEHQLTAANVDRLTHRWSTSAPGRLSEPVTDAGRAYVTHSASGTSAVRADDLATGSLVWDLALPNTGGAFEVTPPVVFSGGDLLVGHPARPNGGTTPCADLRRMDPSSGDTDRTDPGDGGGAAEIAATSDRIYVIGYRNQGASTQVQRVLDAYPASGCGRAECTPEWSAPLDGYFPA